LERFLKDNSVRSVTDFGCGDWQFSQFIDWSGVDYVGFDVVPNIVEANTRRFASEGLTFKVFEKTADLPGGDLLLAKEVFQHLPNNLISEYLATIRKRYKMALITNAIEPGDFNSDITAGGGRPVCINKPPFLVPGAFVFTNSFLVDGVYYQNGTFLMIGD
jgi:SAM-dependent methyltransferase